jgi:spermidine synthase
MLIKRKSIEKEESSRAPKRKAKFAPVTLSEQDGVRYLHFGTEWVQGAMRLRKPDWPELEYAQQMNAWMLFLDEPQEIVQLGLGTAALTKFSYRTFPGAKVTAVDLNPAVLDICYSMFKLPDNDERLDVMEGDALDFVNDEGNHGRFDVIQCDLYDATAKGPVLDTPEFYQACNACLSARGIMTVNLFGDHPSFARNIKAMRFAFDHVICLPEVHNGNVVAICFRTAPELDAEQLKARAAQIVEATKLPAKKWVKGILQG